MARPGSEAPTYRNLAIALAVSLFLAALGLRPRAVKLDRALERSSVAAAAGQPAAAQASLEEALAFDPALASLRLTAANLALQAGDPDAARRHLRAVPAEARTSLLFACLSARLAGGTQVAAVPGCPGEPTRAAGLRSTIPPPGSLDSAAMSLRAQLEANADDLPAWEKLAALTELSHPEGVESVLLRAYRTFPEGSRVLDGIWGISHAQDPVLSPAEAAARTGQLMAARGEWGLAGAAWARALELEPDFPQAKAFLGLATSKTGGDGLPLLLQAAGEAPEDPIVRSLLGQLWLSIGDAGNAVRELSYAQQLDPNNPAITASLASALAQSGRLAEAAVAYRQAASSDPQNPAFWLLLAEFSLRYGFQVESLGLAAARNAVTTSEGDAESLSALGMAAHLSGDSLTGERLLNDALSLDPSSALTWYRYAVVLLDLGRDPEAQRALANAAALDPGGAVGQLADRSLDNLLTGYR